MSMVKITSFSEKEGCKEPPCIEHEVSNTDVNQFLLIETWITTELVIDITLFARIANDNYDEFFLRFLINSCI